MNDERELTLVRLPSDLKERVRAIAGANRRSMAREIQVAVEKHVQAQERT